MTGLFREHVTKLKAVSRVWCCKRRCPGTQEALRALETRHTRDAYDILSIMDEGQAAKQDGAEALLNNLPDSFGGKRFRMTLTKLTLLATG